MAAQRCVGVDGVWVWACMCVKKNVPCIVDAMQLASSKRAVGKVFRWFSVGFSTVSPRPFGPWMGLRPMTPLPLRGGPSLEMRDHA